MNIQKLVKPIVEKHGLQARVQGDYIWVDSLLVVSAPEQSKVSTIPGLYFVTMRFVGSTLTMPDVFVLPSYDVPTIDFRKPDSLKKLRKWLPYIKSFIDDANYMEASVWSKFEYAELGIQKGVPTYSNLLNKLSLQLSEI